MKDDNAWCVDDPVIEWTGRADGIEDAQFFFLTSGRRIRIS